MTSFSIIIPFSNNTRQLLRLLSSFPKDIDTYQELKEVILVDNLSDRTSNGIVQQALSCLSNKFRLVEYPAMASSYASRNYGVSCLINPVDILVFIDSDIIITPGWLQRLICRFYRYKNPKTEPIFFTGPAIKYSSAASRVEPNLAESIDNALFLKQLEYVQNGYAATYFIAVSRHNFEHLGGFQNLTSSADKEFGLKYINIFEKPIELFEDLAVYHPLRSNLLELCRKIKRVGYGKAQTSTKSWQLLFSCHPHFFITCLRALSRMRCRRRSLLFWITDFFAFICAYISLVVSFKLGVVLFLLK